MKFVGGIFWAILFCVSSVLAQPVHICDDEAEFPPYVFWERENGKINKNKITGTGPDLTREIFKLLKMEYTYRLVPWKRCLTAVRKFDKSKNFEVFVNGSYNEKRAKNYYVSVPIHKAHSGIWYSINRFPQGIPIQEGKDLNQFKICGILGYNYTWLPGIGVDQKIDTGAKDIQSAFTKVSKGRCDLFLGSLEVGYGGELTGQYTIPEDIKGIKFPGRKAPTYHYFISKSSPRAYELYTKMNQAIIQLQQKGIAQQIYKKYLPEEGNGL